MTADADKPINMTAARATYCRGLGQRFVPTSCLRVRDHPLVIAPLIVTLILAFYSTPSISLLAVLPLGKCETMDSAATRSIVMSSTAENSSLTHPPSLASAVDKMDWRKEVRYWAIAVNASALGGDNRSKGALAALTLTLFRSLRKAKRQLVEKSVGSGEIRLCPVDQTFAGQMEEIEKIF